MKKQIAQGAEAILYKTNGEVIKDRISKAYRIKQIDDVLRKRRTKLEANLLSKAARVGVPVPGVINIEKTKLKFEFIDGIKVRDWLDIKHPKTKIIELCREIGKSVAKLHNANIIHGDLTTSNMIKKKAKVYFIDFGLGATSQRIEDKAVDLHLFKECLVSKHHKIWKFCWNAFTKSYKNLPVIDRLKQVEQRGRYKARF